MPLPLLPCPPVERDVSSCVAWLGLAYATVEETLLALRLRGINLSTSAENCLLGLREWLFRAYCKERYRRGDRRHRRHCWENTWFSYRKYLEIRSQLVCYGPEGEEIPVPAEPLPGVPTTAL
ncbi:E4 ORF4 [Simian adenovirus 3]|uniref:E4 ORF4 n=1 Tax=Simian adenovirus 3 TaxID=38420 RepID=A0A9W3HRP4_9ADEN|nr:E4 ORF4 [Simian adenovirus 3]AAT84643.1 E4 ORF4 [Simian adenovirus 3]UEC95857.1 E4 ORF4 protein [Simian adenovirus ER]